MTNGSTFATIVARQYAVAHNYRFKGYGPLYEEHRSFRSRRRLLTLQAN